MKNRKLLNFYMLIIALVGIITAVVPIERINADGLDSLSVKIGYYIGLGVLIVALALIIMLALINLFNDNYETVGLMKAFSLISFLTVVSTLVIYSTKLNIAVSWGYILIVLEVFILFALDEIVKMFGAFKVAHGVMRRAFPKQEKPKVEKKSKEKKGSIIIKKKGEKSNVPAQDSNANPTDSTTSNDTVTGELK